MENSLKQRIIGAIVLIALAIIFLPAILKEKASNGRFESKIPKMPPVLEEYQVDDLAINRLASEPPSAIEKQLEEQETKALAQEKEQLATPEVKQAPKPDNKTQETNVSESNQSHQQNPLPKSIGKDYQDAAWVVQVASFSQESNAMNLVKRLKKQGFKAYRRSIKIKKQSLYRVFIGPFVEKTQAQQTLKKIAKVGQTKALVRAFDPIYH